MSNSITFADLLALIIAAENALVYYCCQCSRSAVSDPVRSSSLAANGGNNSAHGSNAAIQGIRGEQSTFAYMVRCRPLSVRRDE